MSSQTAEYHAKLTKKNEQIQALERHTHVVRSALANARAGLKELIAAAEEAEALEAWFEKRATTATDRRIHRVSGMSIAEDRVEAEDVLEAIDKYENAQSVFPPASTPTPEVVELKPAAGLDYVRAAPTLAEAQSAVHIAMTRAVNRLDCDCGATCEGTCTQALLVAAAKKLDAAVEATHEALLDQAADPPVTTSSSDCATLHERSGGITVRGDRLTSFLYDLMQSHLPAGVVEKLMRHAHPDVDYTNGYLAEYARDVADRLRDLPPSGDKTEARKPAEPAADPIPARRLMPPNDQTVRPPPDERPPMSTPDRLSGSGLPELLLAYIRSGLLPDEGWQACDRPMHLHYQFAFGVYDGPVRLLATHPTERCVIVEYTHPEKGPWQAVVGASSLSEPPVNP